MGMFDSLHCQYPLPLNKELEDLDVNWKEVEFQTKSLDCSLSTYTITKGGKLKVDIVEGEWIELPEDQQHKWCSHDFVEKSRRKETVKYHGIIRFYASEYDGDDLWFIDFDAYFSYGQLDKIELVSIDKHVGYDTKQKQFWDELMQKQTSKVYCTKRWVSKQLLRVTGRIVRVIHSLEQLLYKL